MRFTNGLFCNQQKIKTETAQNALSASKSQKKNRLIIFTKTKSIVGLIEYAIREKTDALGK